MRSADQVYISGTTLAQFVSAAYACSSGCKHIFNLYGLRQSARELTDGQENSEKNEIVVLGAVPVDSKEAPPGLTRLGFLTICQAPVHKLSYTDTQRMEQARDTDQQNSDILFHFTKVDGRDSIMRVFYTLYDCRRGSGEPPQTLKLNVDNLVDSLQGFTKIASIFGRNLSTTPTNQGVKPIGETANSEIQSDAFHEVEALAREKAELVKRIVELSSQLRAKAAFS